MCSNPHTALGLSTVGPGPALSSNAYGSHLLPSWKTDSKGSPSFVSKAASPGKGTFISVSKIFALSAETSG
jgi:hypothetical protein